MRNVNGFGLIVCGVCTCASLVISAIFGFSLSDVVIIAGIYSLIGVASVIWEAVGLHRMAHLRREGRGFAAACCGLGLILATIITVQYEIGYLADLFEGKASIGEARAGKREALEAERAELAAQIKKAGTVRPVEAVKGDMEAKAATQAAADAARAAADDEQLRKGCGEICKAHRKRYDLLMTEIALPPSPGSLAAELGTAQAVARAQARITQIGEQLDPLAGAKVADARARYIAKLGVSEETARFMIAALIVLFLWAGRTLGPFVFMDARDRPALPAPGFEPITLAEKKPIPAAEYPAMLGAALSADRESADRPDAAYMAENADDGLSSEELDAYLEIEAAANEAEMLAELTAPGWADRPDQPEPAEELDLQQTRIRRLVESFAGDCLTYNTDDNTHREAAQVMQNAFQLWLTEKNIGETVSKMDFGMHMKRILERAGGAFVKAGSRYYVGAMLNPVWADKLGKAAPIVEPVREPMTDGRRLGRFLDRTGRPPLELEETRGSA